MTNLGYIPEEPIAAIATALSPGAIGIVRVSGKNSIELVSRIISHPKALLEAKGNTLVYSWIFNPSTNEKIDEVMLGVYRNPKSFTGEDMVEIFCHGGVNVVTSVLKVLLANGFRQAERGEFTFRSYINGKTDLTKAEAVKEIIDSKTDASQGRAAGRLAGNLYNEIEKVKTLIVDSLAAIEVEIEYPEDEENISETFDSSKLLEAKAKLQNLADSWKSEKLYQDGARVVLCGKTNAGKSSLFNSLLKEERAIVSDIAGTTRDWLESWANFEGIPVRLFDTAGLRDTDDIVEARGVEITKDLSKEADVILYLADSNLPLTDEDKEFILNNKKIPLVLVLTKSDLNESSSNVHDVFQNIPAVKISSKTGKGIGQLTLEVKNILSKDNSTERIQAGLGSERQKAAVTEALERITHALHTAENGEYGLDAVVQDLEDCLDSVGEITGEVTPDDVLSSVFANFCVGK